jgi:hypothetical protein
MIRRRRDRSRPKPRNLQMLQNRRLPKPQNIQMMQNRRRPNTLNIGVGWLVKGLVRYCLMSSCQTIQQQTEEGLCLFRLEYSLCHACRTKYRSDKLRGAYGKEISLLMLCPYICINIFWTY